MKISFLIIVSILVWAIDANSQMLTADIGINGMTCSMCARGTEETLKRLDFIDTISVDLNTLVAHIRIKKDKEASAGALVKAIDDAGFTVRDMTIEYEFHDQHIEKNGHLMAGPDALCFIDNDEQTLNGKTKLRFIDKSYIPKKEFKELSKTTTMDCYKDGKVHECCSVKDPAHMFHVMLIAEKS